MWWLHLDGDLALTLRDPSTLSDEQLLLNDLDTEARAALIDFWERRADGECTTGRALQHVSDDLSALNAPAMLIEMANVAVSDERRHTEWCLRMSARVGGKSRFEARVLGDKPLAFSGMAPRENRVLRALFAGCISETIALHVLRESQQDIESAALRSVNRQHMAEEVGHGRLGWAFLAWLSESGLLEPSLKKCLERALPVLLQLAKDSWRGGGREGYPKLAKLGFLHTSHVERGIELACDEVILPGFRHFQIELPPMDRAAEQRPTSTSG